MPSLSKEGFLIQISKKEYLLGQGPLRKEKNLSSNSLYVPGFFLNEERPFYKAKKTLKLNKKELEDMLKGKSKTVSFSPQRRVNFCFYSQVFYQIKDQIKKKNLEKAVPIFFEEMDLKSLNPSSFLKALFENTKSLSSWKTLCSLD